jgi:ABC-type transport system substrate-binding protein
MAQLLQNDLQQVGINGKIDVEEEAAWLPQYSGVTYEIATSITGRTSKHPASLFNLNVNFRGDNNYERFGPPEYQSLTAKTLTTLDPTQAKSVYDQLNHIIIDESFDPVVAPQTNYWGLRNYVKGWQSSLDDWDIFETAWLDK